MDFSDNRNIRGKDLNLVVKAVIDSLRVYYESNYLLILQDDFITYFMEGHCLDFSEILCKIFDEYNPSKFASDDHVITKIEDNFFDASSTNENVINIDRKYWHEIGEQDEWQFRQVLSIDEQQMKVKLIDVGREAMKEALNLS